MGNEIAYHDISCAHQIQNFLKQGGAVSLQPGGQLPGPLRTPRSQSVLPTIQNWMTPMHKRYAKGKGVRSGGCGPSSHFLVTVGGNEPLGGIYNWSRWKHGISGGNGTNWEFITKLMWILPSAETCFSWTFKVLKPTSFWGLCTLGPRQGRPPDPTRGPKELLKLLNKSR